MSKLKAIKIGVLGLQGAFLEHAECLKSIGVQSSIVRNEMELDACDGLVIPGGESTAMVLIAKARNMWEPLRRFCKERPVWGTCAGMILLAKHLSGQKLGGQETLEAIDIHVHRNYFGRQLHSASLPILLSSVATEEFLRIDKHAGTTAKQSASPALSERPVSSGLFASIRLPPMAHGDASGVFIRAPAVLGWDSSTCEVLGTVNAAAPLLHQATASSDMTLPSAYVTTDSIAAHRSESSVDKSTDEAADHSPSAADPSCSEGPSPQAEVVVAIRADGGRVLATAFHPELSDDMKWHVLFVDMVHRWKAANTS